MVVPLDVEAVTVVVIDVVAVVVTVVMMKVYEDITQSSRKTSYVNSTITRENYDKVFPVLHEKFFLH